MTAAWCGLGRVLGDNLQAAQEAFHSALKIEPNRLTALLGMSTTLRRVGKHKEAIRISRRAVRICPTSINASVELAQSLSNAARDNEAMRIYRALNKSGLNSVALWFSLASCYANLGQAGRSDYWFRKALTHDPDNRGMRSGYLFMLAASCLKSSKATLDQLRQWERHPCLPEKPFQHKAQGKRRRLRIGYLSPDFHQHVVRQFFEPILWNHDGNQVEIYCYSEARHPDMATWTLRWGADRWFRTYGLSDQEVAQQIYDDKVDVLVDLAGHTAHNRLGVMTWKPAPVQATYLGYFGSTGVSAVDYWISDEVLHPPSTDEPTSETIYRLPRCAYAYGAPAHSPPVMPRESGNPVTFGCFNNVSKVSMDVIDTWAEILNRCHDSQLILKDRRFDHSVAVHIWKKRFLRRGIDPARVNFLGNTPHPEYMATYNTIDIALDTFPRTGGTTTCDALWMGVPVVTLAGNRYVTRLSATKLSAVGAEELITHSRNEYIDTAVVLAQDSEARHRYHSTLRNRMLNGALGDPGSLARGLESAYQSMFDSYRLKHKRN
jgi:predicted O-linked N-acetylglucosamine transferase (SPINDLY family)